MIDSNNDAQYACEDRDKMNGQHALNLTQRRADVSITEPNVHTPTPTAVFAKMQRKIDHKNKIDFEYGAVAMSCDSKWDVQLSEMH